MKNFVDVRFSKADAAEIKKLLLALSQNVPQKKAGERKFYSDIMAPAYEWAVFFGNVAAEK